MIDSLLTPDLIDGMLTRLVLVNAVYFKGLWKSRFQPENTKKRTFVAGDGKSYQVPMLAQLSVFRCGKVMLVETRSRKPPESSQFMNSLRVRTSRAQGRAKGTPQDFVTAYG